MQTAQLQPIQRTPNLLRRAISALRASLKGTARKPPLHPKPDAGHAQARGYFGSHERRVNIGIRTCVDEVKAALRGEKATHQDVRAAGVMMGIPPWVVARVLQDDATFHLGVAIDKARGVAA